MLEHTPYSPTLFTRVAETKALFQLPAATKDRIFPLFLARPWPNANELGRTWEKIHEALGDRRFALDLDRSKYQSGGKKAASADFDALFDPAENFQNYYNLISNVPWAVPVLRVQGGDFPALEHQIARCVVLDRGAVARFERGVFQNPIPQAQYLAENFSDCVFIIDCGWNRNILLQQQWASGIIAAISGARPDAEIVVTGSTFPDSFVNIGARGALHIEERILYGNLRQAHNAANLIYGDWGSTRPPSDPIPMRNIPRIDLPESGQWIFFRQDKAEAPEETYEEIAQRVVSDPSWPPTLNIWGTYTITNTANGLPGGIRSPATAAAARINIHLHRQAYFGANEVGDVDEPFVD